MRTAVRTALAGLILAAPGLAAQDTTRTAPPARDTTRAAPADTTTAEPVQATLPALDPIRRFTVTPHVGTIRWDNSSALANKVADDDGAFTKSIVTPAFGISMIYNVLRQVGVGAYVDAARAETRGDYFPAVLFQYGSDIDLNVVSQRVTVLLYGLQGQFQIPVGRLEPYVGGGFGGVTVFADAQQNDGNRRINSTSAQFGGGLAYNVGGGRVVLDVRDYVFFDWDRDKLNPSQNPAFQNTALPSVNPTPPEKKSTVNNFRIALGFSFVPRFIGGGTTESGDDDDDQPE
jgi:hypothetical protein